MPYDVKKVGSRWCVYKRGRSKTLGCHSTEAGARRQQAKLYVEESKDAQEGKAAHLAQGPTTKNLAMVALYPRPEQAQALAVEGGLDPQDLHVTLVFLGEADQINMDQVTAAVDVVARELDALEGTVGGIGHFTEGPDGVPVVALPDVKGLTLLRERVVDELGHSGIESPSEHGFLPHITLTYVPADEVEDIEFSEVLGQTINFDVLSVVIANDRTDYEFAGARVAELSAQADTVISMKRAVTLPGLVDQGLEQLADRLEGELANLGRQTPPPEPSKEELDARLQGAIDRLSLVTQKERFEGYKLGMEMGILTLNDVLVAEGKEPIAGGDERRVAGLTVEPPAKPEKEVHVHVGQDEKITETVVRTLDSITERLAAGEKLNDSMVAALQQLAGAPPVVNVNVEPTPVTVEVPVTVDRGAQDVQFERDSSGRIIGATVEAA